MTIGMMRMMNYLFRIILEFPARDKHFQIPEHSSDFLSFQNISSLSFQNISISCELL